MDEFEDRVVVIEDMAPTPSPRTIFSSLSDDIITKPVIDFKSIDDDKTEPHFPTPGVQPKLGSAFENDGTGDSVADDEKNELSPSSESKMSSCGGLMERMAARSGFNALRLNTESIISSELSKNAEEASHCFTVPPGLSPTTLLDSPVFLSNPMVLPSPTTGKFLLAPSGNDQISNYYDKGKETTFKNANTSSFEFKPLAESGPFRYYNSINEVNPSSFSPQPFPSARDSVHGLNSSYESSPTLDEPQQDVENQRSSEDPIGGGGGPSDDGYNWRKYGQKHVKGSEYPRSYYKCTHSNCSVKKKVERSLDGHITEIIYKGTHNHARPSNRRPAPNAPGDRQFDAEQSRAGAKNDHIWLSMQNANTDLRQDEPEATSSAPLSQEYSHVQVQDGTQFESVEEVAANSTFSNDDDENYHGTHGSASLGYDGEGDESESKRRKIDMYTPDMSGSGRTIREPRVVVQTTSDVDILDDGYRWRKYGQKVVKGNPNPRSYYKCTSTGCNVRKHVERASHDLKSVITTYEGKHNHDVPAARNSNHVISACSNIIPPQQGSSAASSHKHNPEHYQNQSSSAHFEMPPFVPLGFPSRPLLGPPPRYVFGTNQPGLSNFLGPSQINLPGVPVHPYAGHVPGGLVNNDTDSMVPKEEPKLEPITDSSFDSSNMSSVYQQLISRLPPRSEM